MEVGLVGAAPAAPVAIGAGAGAGVGDGVGVGEDDCDGGGDDGGEACEGEDGVLPRLLGVAAGEWGGVDAVAGRVHPQWGGIPRKVLGPHHRLATGKGAPRPVFGRFHCSMPHLWRARQVKGTE